MAPKAEVGWQGHAHRLGDLRAVLDMTGDALACIQPCQFRCKSRIVELGFVVRILGQLQFRPVAVHARFLPDAAEGRVAALAGQFDLVMPARSLAGEEHAPVIAGKPVGQITGHADRDREPDQRQTADTHASEIVRAEDVKDQQRGQGPGRKHVEPEGRAGMLTAEAGSGRSAQHGRGEKGNHQRAIQSVADAQARMGNQRDQCQDRDGSVSQSPPVDVAPFRDGANACVANTGPRPRRHSQATRSR